MLSRVWVESLVDAHVPHILVIEGAHVEKYSQEVESPMKPKTCPRCGVENEMDALYYNKCSLALDDKPREMKTYFVISLRN